MISVLISFWTNRMCLDRYVHWVSKYMHLTQLMQADWVISTWIINEFENVCQEDVTGKQALIRFLIWKGNKCSGLLCKLRLKQQLKQIGFYAQIFVRTSLFRLCNSQNFYQNQRVLRRSIYIEPVLTSREECNVFADLLF